MKKILFILLSLIIIFFIIFYLINDRLNINKILKKIENEIGISIKLEKKGKWEYYPKLKYQNNLSLKMINDNLIIENSNINISRNYKIISPLIINFESPSILYKGLNFRNSKIISNYKNSTFILNKFTSDLIEGNINANGYLNFDDSKTISLNGSFENIFLNRVLNQLNIENWERVKIKISSPSFNIKTTNGSSKEIIEKLNGNIDIKGSVFFVSTEEERFGATLLSIISDKLTEMLLISKSISYLLDKFADIPSNISGKLNFTNGIISTDNLLLENKKGKVKFSFKFNILNNNIDGRVLFFKENDIFLEAELKGNLQNPEILIEDKILNENESKNKKNIKNIFDKGIQSLVDKLLEIND